MAHYKHTWLVKFLTSSHQDVLLFFEIIDDNYWSLEYVEEDLNNRGIMFEVPLRVSA